MALVWIAVGIVIGVIFSVPLRPVIDRAWAWIKSVFNRPRD